ncbi:hypothetical protein [uncultured Roseobacter sp.]|uniref:hypothetical protein n=1 Tax=uncultured Roseobacter sp. TaxID=114847 RepID=UPI00262C153B|nr:hypothetical protein [uncultured Roseobacter sp.]
MTAAQLWALEPAVSPFSARGALLVGAVVAGILVSLAYGTTPVTQGEDWHGNVAVSTSLAR